MADPQFSAAGGLVEVPDDTGSVTMLASPADFADRPVRPRFRAPLLGEQTAAVLAELGYDDAGIESLIRSGVAGPPAGPG